MHPSTRQHALAAACPVHTAHAAAPLERRLTLRTADGLLSSTGLTPSSDTALHCTATPSCLTLTLAPLTLPSPCPFIRSPQGVKGECFELMQLAFQAHLSGVVARALRRAQHRQDAPRRSAEMVVTSDPRRGVTQVRGVVWCSHWDAEPQQQQLQFGL